MKDLIQEIKESNYKIDTLDGVKIFFKDGWSLFRPSNTEPKIVISYESKTQEGFNKIKSFVEEIIERIPN
jgi:phosphomannomutase/phosphoglucomutase